MRFFRWVCTLKIDQNQLSVGKDAVKKDAETLAFQNGYARLLSECYSIQVSRNILIDHNYHNSVKILNFIFCFYLFAIFVLDHDALWASIQRMK